MMQALESGTESDLFEWRHSGGVDLLDVPGASAVEAVGENVHAQSMQSPHPDPSPPDTDNTEGPPPSPPSSGEVNIPKEVQRRLSILPRSSSDKYHSVFGNLYRRPPKPLSSSAKQ
jgi:hypothetical protein